MPPKRLSAQDAAFLYLERPTMHMHVAGLAVLDPSTRPDGVLRFEDLVSMITSRTSTSTSTSAVPRSHRRGDAASSPTT